MSDFQPSRLAVVDAASAVGDAVLTAATLAHWPVTAASRTPASVVRFSPSVTVARSLDEALAGADGVVLTLGGHVTGMSDEELAVRICRNLRGSEKMRFVVTAPVDALSFRTDGGKDMFAPRRRRTLSERVSPDLSAAELLDVRRAIEIVRLAGKPYTLLAHPRVIVAPGPAEVSRVPCGHSPEASATIAAPLVAEQVMRALREGAVASSEYVLSEEPGPRIS